MMLMTDMILYIFVLVKAILKDNFHNNRFKFCKLNQSMQMNAQANIIIPPFINTGVMLVDKGNLSHKKILRAYLCRTVCYDI